jgi:polysaccharide export outer membrane protein
MKRKCLGCGLAALLALAVLAGGGAPVAAAQSGAAPVAQVPPSTAAPAAAGTVSPDYIIGPGDTIQVFVWRNPELSVTVPVRPDGKISTPLNEDMVAVGKTPSTLARDIEAKLAEYVRSPTVNIIVSNPQSAFSQVKVIGQVKTPQNVAYREGMTVLDAVLAVGGLTDFAAPGRTKIVRRSGEKGAEKTEELKVPLDKVLEKGELKYNVALKAGDVIVVPESRF